MQDKQPAFDEQANFFLELRGQDEENKRCFECSAPYPGWATVPLGLFLCINCSARHRGFGVHLSFVRSLTLDLWTPKQLRFMELGGNRRARLFFADHPLQQPNQYSCSNAVSYRHLLRCKVATALGEPEPEPLTYTPSSSTKRISSISSDHISSAEAPIEDPLILRFYNCCTIL